LTARDNPHVGFSALAANLSHLELNDEMAELQGGTVNRRTLAHVVVAAQKIRKNLKSGFIIGRDATYMRPSRQAALLKKRPDQ